MMDDVRWMKDYPYKMTVEQARAFGEDVLNIVSQIPHGRVTTYGHIAALAGWPSHSRMVGRTLRYSPGYWRKRVYLSSLMGMWICSIIFGNRREGDEG